MNHQIKIDIITTLFIEEAIPAILNSIMYFRAFNIKAFEEIKTNKSGITYFKIDDELYNKRISELKDFHQLLKEKKNAQMKLVFNLNKDKSETWIIDIKAEKMEIMYGEGDNNYKTLFQKNFKSFQNSIIEIVQKAAVPEWKVSDKIPFKYEFVYEKALQKKGFFGKWGFF
eukprot:TRINITY_DN6768_c0_g1_i1.p1 TRINITY_DN6768_c0_g1~~TRINITY_DN6768_c0_g1_i1.p1  ORF type:complete len:171 (+),score=45.24 TRINITY_DN6768_c0_g1_i1:20-532(+)